MKACYSFRWMMMFFLSAQTNSNILMVIKLKATIIVFGTNFRENFFFFLVWKMLPLFHLYFIWTRNKLEISSKDMCDFFLVAAQTQFTLRFRHILQIHSQVLTQIHRHAQCASHTHKHTYASREQKVLNHNAQLKPFKVNKIKIWVKWREREKWKKLFVFHSSHVYCDDRLLQIYYILVSVDNPTENSINV